MVFEIIGAKRTLILRFNLANNILILALTLGKSFIHDS